MKKIILDTNFIIYCTEKKIDYKTEIMNLSSSGYELVVPAPVVLEIMLIAQNTKKYSDKKAAKLALDILEHNHIRSIETKTNIADDAIVELAEGNSGSIVASLDLQLRKRLKSIAKILIINSSKELAFV